MKKIFLLSTLGLFNLAAQAGQLVTVDRYLYILYSQEFIPTIAEKELMNKIKTICGNLEQVKITNLSINFSSPNIQVYNNTFQVAYPKYKASAFVECHPQE